MCVCVDESVYAAVWVETVLHRHLESVETDIVHVSYCVLVDV